MDSKSKKIIAVTIAVIALLIGIIIGMLLIIWRIPWKLDFLALADKDSASVKQEKIIKEDKQDELEYTKTAKKVFDLLGSTEAEVREVFGEPKEYNPGDMFGWRLWYDFGVLEAYRGDNQRFCIYCIEVQHMLDMEGKNEVPLADVKKALGISADAEGKIGTGQGDYAYIGEGVPYVEHNTDEYYIQVSYDGEDTVREDDLIVYFGWEIMYGTRDEKNYTSTPQLDSSQIENEVTRIRNIYNETVQACNSGQYTQKAVDGQVTAAYDASGDVRRVIAKKGYDGIDYTQYYYYENGKLIFAYYESADAHRLYYYHESLFRWRYSPNAAKSSEATNHDNENSSEFAHWGDTAKTTGKELYSKCK